MWPSITTTPPPVILIPRLFREFAFVCLRQQMDALLTFGRNPHRVGAPRHGQSIPEN